MTDKSKNTETLSSVRRKKSLQGHQYRRRTKPLNEQYEVELSCVLGLIVRSNCAFTCNEASGSIAYPAGCVIVICQVREKNQFYIFNPGRKNLTCIQYSSDGQNLVTGESGHHPCVRVFSISERCQVTSFQAHKFGISCVAFSPNCHYIVSVGYQHDNIINVWNWKKNILSAANKVSIKVRAIAFAEDSSYFVTVGNRHVKFWYIEESKAPDKLTIPLKGRSGILGSVRNHLFCDVTCGVGNDEGYTFALSRSGMVCQFSRKRTLEKSVQIKTSAAYCICVVNGIIICGCSESQVYLYSIEDLQIITSFNSFGVDSKANDLVAVRMDSKNMWMHCVHSDHSLHIWDLLDTNNPVEHSAIQFHSECVWDVQVLASDNNIHSFLTCSNDRTVRRWNMTQENGKLVHKLSVDTETPDVNTPDEKASKIGVRAVCIIENGEKMAVGDRNGVIRIFNLNDGSEKELAKIKLHDGDVLYLDYCPSLNMLVTASRDRCIYLLNAEHAPVYTINVHSAAVNAVKFANVCGKVRLISCGGDKSIYFCTVTNNEGQVNIVRDQHIVEKHSMHDMAIINNTVLVACGAGLHEYDIENGRHLRFLKGNETAATVLRVTTNDDGNLVAISCADKFVYVLSYQTGEMLLDLGCHSEICTAFAFFTDKLEHYHYLVAANADSCIFLWKLRRCIENNDISDVAEDCAENGADALDMTNYFYNHSSMTSLLVDGVPSSDISLNLDNSNALNAQGDGEECMEVNSARSACDENGIDVLLPSWITGNREKSIKNQIAHGKWANRLKDHYTNGSILDTPVYHPDWEICQKDECEEDHFMGEFSEEIDEMSRENSQNCLHKDTDSPNSSPDANSDCDDFAISQNSGNINPSPSSSQEVLVEKRKSPEREITENGSDNNKKDVPEVKVEQVQTDHITEIKSDISSNSEEASQPIPPAFADFLQNLSKKKRSLPTSLPLPKSYQNGQLNGTDASPTLLSSPRLNNQHSNPARLQPIHGDGECMIETASVDEIQQVARKLLTSYEQAETIYKQIASTAETPRNKPVKTLLSDVFTIISIRIQQMQGNIQQKQDNLSPVTKLLQEYSDKLMVLMKDEVKKTL